MLLYEMFEAQEELTFIDALSAFLPLAMEHLGLKKLPKIHLRKDLKTQHLPSFGQFSNDDNVINVDIANRHPNDVLRTLAHEMTHYWQNTQGMLGHQSWRTGSPDEDQANAEAGVIMRKFNQTHPEFMRLKPIVIGQEQVDEEWSEKYKRSINCNNPKGFSQRAHCAGRKKANENFADGKKPGRKGLAKRVGVDCSQSISKLRSIAKSSSGERQRMAHWCANMKSGKNK